MVDGLAQANEQVEDVRVVVEHRAARDVRAERRLRLRVERLVFFEVFGLFVCWVCVGVVRDETGEVVFAARILIITP